MKQNQNPTTKASLQSAADKVLYDKRNERTDGLTDRRPEANPFDPLPRVPQVWVQTNH